MKKSDIVIKLAKKYPDISKQKMALLTDQLFQSISNNLANGNRIEIRGFGVFSLRPRKPGKVRNPRHGVFIDVGARHSINFRPSKKLASLVDPQND